VAHVELSLTEAFVPLARAPHDPDAELSDILSAPTVPNGDPGAVASFGHWAATVAAAEEACLVIDAELRIVAASATCCKLFGIGDLAAASGLHLLDAGLRLVDFTAARGELAETEIDKIPPLLAVTSGRLARGLLRVTSPEQDGDATVDAVATPLTVGGRVAGSLTFFSVV
jgi:PAS domain-containing protein